MSDRPRLRNRAPAVRAALACLALMLCAPAASAHQVNFSTATLRYENGGYELELVTDLNRRLAEGAASPEAQEAWRMKMTPAARNERLARFAAATRDALSVKCDGAAAPGEPSFPDRILTAELSNDALSWPGQTVRLRGRLPAGARSCSVRFAADLGPVEMRRLVGRTAQTPQLLAPGDESAPLLIIAPESADAAGGFNRYLWLGFRHILPDGIDHILFVLGLFLLSTRLKPLLWQISAFTVAHSLTLGLAMAGWVSLPSRIVEPLIALSIAVIAVENLMTDRLHAWRPALVFLFGLLHGMGFAGGLRELGLPAAQFFSGLFGFNAGVELGQLAVIAAALLAVGLFRARAWYRPRIVMPASALIAAVAVYWTVTRAISP